MQWLKSQDTFGAWPTIAHGRTQHNLQDEGNNLARRPSRYISGHIFDGKFDTLRPDYLGGMGQATYMYVG